MSRSRHPCGFAPENLTSLAHFSVSSAMSLLKSEGEPFRVLVAVEEVWHMNRPRFEHRPAGHPAAVERLSLTEGKSTEARSAHGTLRHRRREARSRRPTPRT